MPLACGIFFSPGGQYGIWEALNLSACADMVKYRKKEKTYHRSPTLFLSTKESPLKKKRSKYGHCPERGGGSTPAQMFLEHFIMDLYIWARCQNGRGGEGLAKIFGSLLKVLYCWIPLKQFWIWAKCPRGGGFGACQKYWSTFLGLLTTLDFLKVLEERTVFKSLIHFQGPTKWNFTLFCRILQNVAIYS